MPSPSPPLRPHPHLYEINTWVWLQELSGRTQRELTLGDIPDQEWDALKEKGFDCVWLMGIWERSAQSRAIARSLPFLRDEYDQALPGWQESDVVGSPYAIRAYRPDPALGTWDDVERILRKLHDRGMQLILDFVPNHTSLDHEWVASHPEYYIQGQSQEYQLAPHEFFVVGESDNPRYLAHGRDPFFSPWTDTAQLNYFHGETRAAMMGVLDTIAPYCDGIRCDMAMLILNEVFHRTWGRLLMDREWPANEFWSEAIAGRPGWLWIAEVYWDLEWDMQQLGFQYTYDKRLYERLRQFNPQGIVSHLRASLEYQRKLVRFLENHDEARSAVVFGRQAHSAFSVLLATLPGLRLYHQGQLEGKRVRLPVQLGRSAAEPLDETTVSCYSRLLKLSHEDVFHFGNWRLLSLEGEGEQNVTSLLAYQWTWQEQWKMIVVNLSPAEAQGRVCFTDEFPFSEQEYACILLQDIFSDCSYEFGQETYRKNGLLLKLAPYEWQIFSVMAVRGGFKS